MTARPQRLKPIGFWSYARQDDEASDGRLSQLRGQLARELQEVYGRQKIQLWQDVAAIPPGAEWDKAIDDAIAQSTFLIPIVTPAFVESEFCCGEVAKFFKREAEINAAHPELAGQRRIFPIVYIDTQDCDPYDPDIIAQLEDLQFVDFRQLREDDDPQQIRRAVVRLAGEIARLLKIKVAPPPSPEELEKQRLAKEAEERAEAQRKRKEEEERERRAQEQREEAQRAAERERAERERREEAAALEAKRLEEKKREERERREKEAQEKAKRRKEQRDKMMAAAGSMLTMRAVMIGAAAVVVGLVLWLPSSGTLFDSQPSSGPEETSVEPDVITAPAPDPAAPLIGAWTLESVPCESANASNGQQVLARDPQAGWSINAMQVAGSEAPDAQGWFEIDGLYWRRAGDQLELSAEGGEDASPTILNRCTQ